MTLEEFERALRERKVTALNVDLREGVSLTLFRGKRCVQGSAAKFEDAVEVTLLRWDGTWK